MSAPDKLLRKHLRERYLITLVDGSGFDGLIVDADWTHLVLADVEQIDPAGNRVKADGTVWVPRQRIDYMQQPRV